MSNGKVFLIGAGPGDPELLTVKAVRALAQADIVLIDDLVDRRVLEFAPHARVIAVGKRGGCKSTPQAFIERLMVRNAMRGKTVARVKGGDPFVFGRGGEETLTLARAGISCEVIPGVTAGMPAETPPAAIQHGTAQRQRHVIATLVTLADAVRDAELGSPALIVIGRVVGLARSIGQVEQLHRVA